MDFKGMRWVGNVYQKFEAMCLEVEEIIVQDTAKYVENQVLTVGNTVKKFCSDVVQDLRTDESLSSEKPSPVPVAMLHEYAPVCSFKKKRESLNRKGRDVVKQEREVNEGKKDGCAMKLRGLDADDYDICTSPRQDGYGGPYRRTRLGRCKQVSRKEEIFQVTRPSYMQRDSGSLSMVHRTRVKDDLGTVRSSDSPLGEVKRLISKEKKDGRTKSENGLVVVNSVRGQDSVVKTENEQGLKVVNSVRSQDSESRNKNEHGLMVVNSVRTQDSEIQTSVATSLPAGSDDCTKETNEESMRSSSSFVSEKKPDVLQQLSGRSVEESCIIVDRDELHCVFLDRKENDRHKPYKKIRDAISSRMKQNREKEYKRLARQWYAEDVENGRECGDDPKQIEENRSSEESEWELL
ncbi:unnamed protein product [Microthlaspi erraticum]|uniref:Uncharacterized protein n=1 Tax=Microthlaspi erraticum TaxID=1685480 RepID=A0A6D2KEG5_9BRAS|nr:unnamed protein product [Microthlaspi erraticum]